MEVGRGGGRGRGRALTDQTTQSLVQKHRDIGNVFVEARIEEGKSKVYCGSCRKTFDRETTFEEHFNSVTHGNKLKVDTDTLIRDNPWPFNDGTYLFHGEQYGEVQPAPEVGLHTEFHDVQLVGYGHIVAKYESLKVLAGWCEWLGFSQIPVDNAKFSKFAILTFKLDICPRKCFVCDLDLLEGKDASTFLNTRTMRIACKPNYLPGFNLFHPACLVRWLVVSECQKVEEAFCPICLRDGDDSRPNEFWSGGIGMSLASQQVEKLKTELSEGFRQWNCGYKYEKGLIRASIGLNFCPGAGCEPPTTHRDSLKYVKFYRAVMYPWATGV